MEARAVGWKKINRHPMPQFKDPSMALSLTGKTERVRKAASLSKYLESERSYAVSDEREIAALESAKFADDYYERAASPDHSKDILNLEYRLLPVLARMESRGVHVNAPLLRDLSVRLEAESKRLLSEMKGYAGDDFNPASTKQVQHVLFERLGIPVSKKNKTGFSVDSEVLEEVAKIHPL